MPRWCELRDVHGRCSDGAARPETLKAVQESGREEWGVSGLERAEVRCRECGVARRVQQGQIGGGV
jgi:hypothetical protein